MKLLYGIAIIALIMAVAIEPDIEQKAEEQIHHSEMMCDSAAMVLDEIHNLNDSLMIEKYLRRKIKDKEKEKRILEAKLSNIESSSDDEENQNQGD